MPYKAPLHYIWLGFCQMAKNERITAAQAVERLQAAFPFEPVEVILRAEGDVSRTREQLLTLAELDQGQQSSRVQESRPVNNPRDLGQLSGQTGNLTAADIQNAGTGRKVEGNGAYDAQADPFRSRFVERAERRG